MSLIEIGTSNRKQETTEPQQDFSQILEFDQLRNNRHRK
ncbi:hypothetical protein Q669_21255 [Labrenzia sp. C1B10]|nr:hypothetical protein Q669_21255 [Labrenzia sp. C1B10]ERS01527.1 hypothetical protein Q675_05370 [Labrenzia sp. C1B70]